MATQYRIYEKLTDGRCYVSYAYVDPTGVASYSWTGKRKDARLFDSADIALGIATAMEKTIAAKYGSKVKLIIAPASGGHEKFPYRR